jgi:hypothetical protein
VAISNVLGEGWRGTPVERAVIRNGGKGRELRFTVEMESCNRDHDI